MRIRNGGAWRPLETGRAYTSGSWRLLVIARAYVGGEWRDIASFVTPLTFEAVPTATSGSTRGAGLVTTRPVTATPTGGRTPFTYSWVRISGVGTIDSPTAARTTFSQTLAEGQNASGTFRCTVTDSGGATATTGNVHATFFSNDFTTDF